MSNLKKKLVIISIMLMSFLCINSLSLCVEAKTGSYYEPEIVEDSSTVSSSLGESIVSTIASVIFDWVTKLVMTVGELIESLITKFSVWMFNVNCFPWEDYIVYNTLPYLDINFFNPDSDSLFSTGIGSVVQTVYFSLLTLSLTVLGIGVAVVAIKLAISSIASEKAKYKESIMKCLYTVIMLFSVHILISFIFYLNEEICDAAAQLLNALTSGNEDEDLVEAIENSDGYLYQNFICFNCYPAYTDSNTTNSELEDESLGGAVIGALEYAGKGAVSIFYSFDDATDKNYMYDDEYEEYYNKLIAKYPEAEKIGNYLVANESYMNSRFAGDTYIYATGDNAGHISSDDTDAKTDYSKCVDAAGKLYRNVWNIVRCTSLEEFQAQYEGDRDTTWYHTIERIFVVYTLKQHYNVSNTIISSLAIKFRDYGDLAATKDNPADTDYVGAYLYAIMLVQSVMLLITYIKRLFYVTILSVLAPIVIIYDFFMNESNKVFTTWFKELCSLVFVQSMQAMLLTVMLAVVVGTYLDNEGNANMETSMGIFAIIVMVLIPKVELLVKRIFGLGSGVMDDSMMGGKNSLAKGMMALRLGGRVLDNGAKMVGGLGAAAMGIGSAKFGSVKKKGQIAENNRKALEAQGLAGGSQSGSSSGGSNASRPLTQGGLMDAIRNAGKEDPEEAAERAKHENAQAIRGGLKQAASGLVETAGALGGAGLGAVYSLGTGGDDLAANMVAGAGIGDAVGEGLTNATLGTANRLADWNYERKQLNKKVKASEDKLKAANEYKKTINDAKKVQPPTGTKSVKRAIKRPTSNTTTKTKSQNPAGSNNTSRSLSSSAKQYYDKALDAKSKGNMDAYKQNRAIAAGMMKSEKKAASKASASTKAKTYTKDNTTQLKNSTLADINRVKRAKDSKNK